MTNVLIYLSFLFNFGFDNIDCFTIGFNINEMYVLLLAFRCASICFIYNTIHGLLFHSHPQSTAHCLCFSSFRFTRKMNLSLNSYWIWNELRLKTNQTMADVHVYHLHKQVEFIQKNSSTFQMFYLYLYEIMNNLTVVIISKQI